MDFSLTEAQQELSGLARRILSEKPSWTELVRAGVVDSSLDLLELCSVWIEMGRAAASLPYLSPIVGSAVSNFDGVGTIAFNGSDGAFTNVPYATEADLILVPDGDVTYLVKPDDVTIEPQRLVNGDTAAFVTLSATPTESIPVSHDWLYRRSVLALCALQLGVVERALELTATYATERIQFGRPIGTFQAVTQRLADAYIDVEAIRLTMWQAAWLMSSSLPCDVELAVAKFWAADGGHRVAHTAVHIHGGVGIDMDHSLQRYFVAAKHNEFALGNATAQLLRIGATL